MSRLDSLRLNHDPNEGLRTGGTDQNTALSVQRILVLTHLLPQAFIAHNTLLVERLSDEELCQALQSGNADAEEILHRP